MVDAPEGNWGNSDFPIAMFGDDRYLMARGEDIFVLDEEFEITDTVMSF